MWLDFISGHPLCRQLSSFFSIFLSYYFIFLWGRGCAEWGAGASGEGRVRINGLSKTLINQVIL